MLIRSMPSTKRILLGVETTSNKMNMRRMYVLVAAGMGGCFGKPLLPPSGRKQLEWFGGGVHEPLEAKQVVRTRFRFLQRPHPFHRLFFLFRFDEERLAFRSSRGKFVESATTCNLQASAVNVIQTAGLQIYVWTLYGHRTPAQQLKITQSGLTSW